MRSTFFALLGICCLCLFQSLEAKLPVIDAKGTGDKIREIMSVHATHKVMTPELVKRILNVYIESLDPAKTYFLESDIDEWLNPSDSLVQQITDDIKNNQFPVFFAIDKKMAEAIVRRRELEKQIDMNNLPKNVRSEEFKDIKWAKNNEELQARLLRLRGLQAETFSKLEPSAGSKDQMANLFAKRQAKIEEDYFNIDPVQIERLAYNNLLKAVATSLDTHSAYFTPDEARQFMINVQQRLFGIGAQLRDDLNGFSVVKIIEGGPAAQGKKLKVKDRIIAVDKQPVVGMDIVDAVDLIRGEKSTPVTLTIIREEEEGDKKKEVKMDIEIMRGEVVLTESRYDAQYVPFGNAGFAHLRLHSFYQDADSSSATDLTKALKKISSENRVEGVVLDLRSNSGGLLTQAVSVAGLFLTKGVIVSIKDENGQIQHLRDLDGTTIWDGPLLVLINKGSASASEIVAQTLQDYGRAFVVGDAHSYGKGSFQTFTLNPASTGGVNPEGEYKVTRGRYYTVSGKTPQLHGVESDIVVPGPFSEIEMGEQFAKYPLEGDTIKPNFDDDLSDVPFTQRARIGLLYKFNLQPKIPRDTKLFEKLKSNSAERIKNSKYYQAYITELKKKTKSEEDIQEEDYLQIAISDPQLEETYNIMRDYIILKGIVPAK